MNKILVDLASNRSYQIIIGNGCSYEIEKFILEKKYNKIFIITDKNVAKFCLPSFLENFNQIKIRTEKIIVEAGEKTKSFLYLEKICEKILSKGVDRKSLIIAFGGGVVGDLSGFISSILLRGIDFIQVPTTLLAAVDSSVGGKTAINSKSGKNLIGSFYQPKLVVCDLNFLKTLPIRQIKSGYAEIVKYGFIFDKKFFEFLEKNYKKIFEFDQKILIKIIAKSCEIKAKIVSEDENENGQRALLNFGHTFGHVFETETSYSDELLHGEAVALGMAMATKMSFNLKMISEFEMKKILNHLKKCGFIINHQKIRKKWNEKNLIDHLYKDKKNNGDELTFILLKKIGEAIIQKKVPLDEFRKIIL